MARKKKKKTKVTLATLDARDYYALNLVYPEDDDQNEGMGGGSD